MSNTNKLAGVMLTPNAKHEVLDVGSLLDQLGASVIFTAGKAVYNNRKFDQATVLGHRTRYRLYRVTDKEFRFVTKEKSKENQLGFTNLSEAQVPFQLLRERVTRLHRMFRHPGKTN